MAESRRHWLRVAAGVGVIASASQLVAQTARETWRVGFISNYPPFSQFNSSSQRLQGFDVDILQAVAEHERMELHISHAHAPEVFQWLEQGKIDFIGNQILATPDMRERFIFAQGYVDLRLILAQRENDERDFLSLEDFQGFKLGVLEGTAADEQGSAVLGPDVLRFNSTAAGLQAVLAKRIDAFMDENLILDHLIFQQGLAIKTTTPFSPAIRTGWALRPAQRALRERMNQSVAWLKTQGPIGRISRAWFGYDVSQERAGAVVITPPAKR